jgi:hypothetical protein
MAVVPATAKAIPVPINSAIVRQAIKLRDLVWHRGVVFRHATAVGKTGGTHNWRQFSALNSTATSRRKLSQPRRISTATSKTAPRVTRIRFLCSIVGSWWCRLRTSAFSTLGVVILHKQDADPISTKLSKFHTSEKSGESSIQSAITILISEITVSAICIDLFWTKFNLISIMEAGDRAVHSRRAATRPRQRRLDHMSA